MVLATVDWLKKVHKFLLVVQLIMTVFIVLVVNMLRKNDSKYPINNRLLLYI